MPSPIERAATGIAIHRRASPLKVRADWVVQQIKQREHAKSVAQLAAQNLARWRAINPEWAAHGPELVLTSRGTPGRVVASQGAGMAGWSDLPAKDRSSIAMVALAGIGTILVMPRVVGKGHAKTAWTLGGLMIGLSVLQAKAKGAF
jgi:hypothetical protein